MFRFALHRPASAASFHSMRRQGTSSESHQTINKKGGVGKSIIWGCGAVITGLVSTVGYAHYDPKFRQQLELNVPHLKPFLDTLLGEPTLTYRSENAELDDVTNTNLSGSSYISDLKVKVDGLLSKSNESDTGLSKKKDDNRTVSHHIASESLLESKRANVANQLTMAKTESKEVVNAETASTSSQSDESAKANADLEESMKYAISSAEKKMELVSNNKRETIESIKKHAQLLREAVDDSKNPKWMEVTAALDQSQYKSKRDNASEIDMMNFMDNIRKIVNDGRSSNQTVDNPILVNANETLNRYQYELDTLNSQVNRARREGQIMNEYRDLIEKSRRHFADELKSILPTVDLNAKGRKLTDDELNALIAHAHLRVDQLRRQLTEHQVREEERINEAIERQKAEDVRVAQEQLELEMGRLHALRDADLERQMAESRSEWRHELYSEMSLAAAAHQEHLEQVIRKEKELSRLEQTELVRDALGTQAQFYQGQVGGALSRLHALNTALFTRLRQDRDNRRAKEMWLACENLLQSVVHGRREAADCELRRKPLANQLISLKESSTNDDFIQTILKSLSDESLYNGVYTEDDLKSRFLKIYKLGWRTAKISDDGGTLFQYIRSFLMSCLIFDVPKHYSNSEKFYLDKMDTFAVLSRARYYLYEKQDMPNAIKLIQVLHGEPARLARDWIKDARTHLETKQAAELLMAYATAVAMRSLY